MKKAYILVYGTTLGTRDEVKAMLDGISEIITWRSEILNVFYLISEASAITLSERIKKRADLEGKKDPLFLVSEIESNRQGWLPPETWFLLENKYHKPKS